MTKDMGGQGSQPVLIYFYNKKEIVPYIKIEYGTVWMTFSHTSKPFKHVMLQNARENEDLILS